MKSVRKIGLAYGAFLIAAGVLGWASTGFSARGKTAILSGLLTGLVIWALVMVSRRGPAAIQSPTHWLMLAFTLLFAGTFTWRSVVAWQGVLQGSPKIATATLLSVMAVVSLITVVELGRRRPKIPVVEPGPG